MTPRLTVPLFTLARTLLCMSGLAAVGGNAVAAQPPVTITTLPGFDDNQNRWASAKARLEAEFGAQIDVRSPWYETRRAIDLQAADVASMSGGLDSTRAVLLGHSAGGIVARRVEALPTHRFNGVVTVASPHLGAPIADNIFQADQWATLSIGQVMAPFLYYVQQWGDFEAALINYDAAYMAASFFVHERWLSSFMASGAIADLRTTSSIMSPTAGGSMNAPSNLAREVAELPNRWAIVLKAPTYAPLCVALEGVQELVPWDWCAFITQGLALAYYSQYSRWSEYYEPSDIYAATKRQYAYLWLQGGAAFQWANAEWCTYIGAAATGCESDGLIPAWSQRGWGGANVRELSEPVSHQREPQNWRVQSQIVDVLRTGNFHVQ